MAATAASRVASNTTAVPVVVVERRRATASSPSGMSRSSSPGDAQPEGDVDQALAELGHDVDDAGPPGTSDLGLDDIDRAGLPPSTHP